MCVGTASADVRSHHEFSQELARWLLASPRKTEPLPAVGGMVAALPPPPDATENGATGDEAESRSGSWVKAAPAVPPPPPGRRLFAGEYASQHDQPPQNFGRLPPPEDDADRVRFAGGAIEFAVPRGWTVAESDHFRHVRLTVAPPNESSPNESSQEESSLEASSAGGFAEGIWISYHVQPPSEPAERELRRFMALRLPRVLPGNATARPAKLIRIADHLALKQPFQSAGSSHPREGEAQGFHTLISTAWGIVEVHARFQSEAARQQIEMMTAQMQIGASLVELPPASGTTAADAIVGVWKGERARLVLTPGGGVELIYDKARPRRLDRNDLARPPKQLRGRYRGDADTLHITWSDGSRLNLRWARRPGELLLTDHLGRVSQLKRLLE